MGLVVNNIITCDWGLAILLGGHFQNLDFFCGGDHFQIRGALLGGSFNSYESGI